MAPLAAVTRREMGVIPKPNSVMGDFVHRQQSGPEQLRVGSAEHRTLQGFEPVDLAFSLPIAPALDHRVADPVATITEFADDPHFASRDTDDRRWQRLRLRHDAARLPAVAGGASGQTPGFLSLLPSHLVAAVSAALGFGRYT
jgi:hypothetical protein